MCVCSPQLNANSRIHKKEDYFSHHIDIRHSQFWVITQRSDTANTKNVSKEELNETETERKIDKFRCIVVSSDVIFRFSFVFPLGVMTTNSCARQYGSLYIYRCAQAHIAHTKTTGCRTFSIFICTFIYRPSFRVCVCNRKFLLLLLRLCSTIQLNFQRKMSVLEMSFFVNGYGLRLEQFIIMTTIFSFLTSEQICDVFSHAGI